MRAELCCYWYDLLLSCFINRAVPGCTFYQQFPQDSHTAPPPVLLANVSLASSPLKCLCIHLNTFHADALTMPILLSATVNCCIYSFSSIWGLVSTRSQKTQEICGYAQCNINLSQTIPDTTNG